ncbi:hypothetical protein MMC14_009362 [Varicellaria rhodocarpa]|nr:hypothetical protein [Varicellaria rhodocarpa]
MRLLSVLAILIPLVLGLSPSHPPAVNTQPFQAAINALSTTSTTAQSIFIEAGTYSEQVYIPARKAQLIVYGSTSDTASYTSNMVTITHSASLATSSNDDATATVRNWATNTKFYNVNIANTFGKSASNGQALAISAYAGNQGYYGCQFKGYQDTVLAETGNQVFAKSLIIGATDFIFGQTATAWFDQVDIRVLATSYGTISASGRDSSTNPSWYVINNSTVAAQSGQYVPAGAYYLGRPWRQYARVVFQETSLTNVINSAGWIQWSSSSPNTADVVLEEYDNTGAGASGTRANFSEKINSPIPITTVLGSSYASAFYVDTSYLS